MTVLLGGSALAAAAWGQGVQPPLSDRTAPIAPPSQAPVAPPPQPGAPPEAPPPNTEPASPHTPTSGLDLDMLRTRDLTLLYFDPSETYLTPHIARSYENSLAFQKRTFDWKPWEPTTVFLKDFGDYGNAGARAAPNDALLIDVAPLSLTYETFSPGERFFTLMNHEMVHVATMDVWNSRDAFWRHALGGKVLPVSEHPESILYSFLSTPRVNVPRWYLEGSAVFFETWMSGGLGRAQGGYDEMAFRAKVRDGSRFFTPLGLESEGTAVDFQVGVNDYLYGTRFFSYLAIVYGPQKVLEWLKRPEASRGYYSLQFRQVFGKPLDAAWQDWITYEKAFQKRNLAQVSQYPLTPLHRLTPTALGSISRSFYDPETHSLIGAFRYPGVIGHMGVLSLETGKVRRLRNIKGQMLYKVTSTAYDPESHTAFYTTDNYAYRDLMALDVRTGAARMLIKDGRIGDMVFNPKDKSLWGVRHLNGLVTLVQIPKPYSTWRQVHTFPYGEMVFDPDISPDGDRISVSYGQIDGTQSVRIYDLAELDNAEPKPRDEFKIGQSVPESFVFSPDGKALYGDAYYTGVANIYRYDLATRKVEAVSNTDTGLFRPIPMKDGSLIAYSYTGEGFAPVSLQPKPLEDLGNVTFLGSEIARKQPVVTTWGVGSPAKVPLESLITERGKYAPWRNMRVEGLYPALAGYKGDPAAGLAITVEDPLQLSQLTGMVSYSLSGAGLSDAERLHADLQYRSIAWRFEYWHNFADFYSLFGPTDRSRKGDAFIATYKKTPIYDLPRQLDLTASAAYYTGLDTLPQAQNVGVAGDRDIASLALSAKYTNTEKSLGAIDYERGVRWNLDAGVDEANSRAFPSIRAGLGLGVPLIVPHTSFWLYSAAGAAGGDGRNPLSRFYFGSFGNNYVDDGEVKRYREYDSFPGFDIDEISARRFGKLLGELNLPPVRFSDVGRPSFYLGSVRSALFAGALGTDDGSGRYRFAKTVGGQADLNFTVALRLPMVLSLGYAHGFADGGSGRDEVMFSIKIL